MIRILMVDDHPSARDEARIRITEEGDMTVTAAGSGQEALDLLCNGEVYDVMLVDLNMPGMSGLELTRKIMNQRPESRIVIYTGHDIAQHFNMLIEAGVYGFVSKASSWEQLILAIRCALKGESVIPTVLLRQLRRTESRIPANLETGHSDRTALNEKEQSILQGIALGKSNKEIAEDLLISQRTVEDYLSRIFEKMGVRSRIEAIAEAQKRGMIFKHEVT